ncbi:hypothetical protein CEXT_537391 [Caerostris extrusa]|uniref:Uncharacterized protein n=1 Tax=Caerostris extrusa TaxID=172846 RepID=A0AAV4VHW4_CAEEX|nr:hypothetical protein CEXT_537391 [Caerostris extrusa]
MIYGERNNSHPLIEYSVADIEKMKIRKRLSKYMPDFETGWKSGYLLCNAVHFYDAMKEMENSKWRSFYKDVGDYLPDSHINKRNASYYEQMVKRSWV